MMECCFPHYDAEATAAVRLLNWNKDLSDWINTAQFFQCRDRYLRPIREDRE